MNIIDKIKQARQNLLPEERKQEMLTIIEGKLSNGGKCVIYGAPHFERQEWGLRVSSYYAPYNCHEAIADWLNGLGFKTSRYYNKGGVEQGLLVEI